MQLYAVKGVLVYKTNYMATLVLSHIIIGTTKYEGKYYHFFEIWQEEGTRERERDNTHKEGNDLTCRLLFASKRYVLLRGNLDKF